jgi:hypothetical protein
MKRFSLTIVATVFLLAPLAAASITVSKPGGGGFCLGNLVEITWIKSGDMQATATIALRYAGSAPDAAPALVIATGESNDGWLQWTIPNTIAPGDYFIRVRTDDATVIGDGPVFKIVSSPAILVSSPKANDQWCLGDPWRVKWDKLCSMQNTVTIALRAEGSAPDAAPARVIVTGEANDGFYGGGNIPADLAPGNYFIRVRTDDASVIGDSGVFRIKECAETAKIQLTRPNGGETWWENVGALQPIEWRHWNWNGTVKLLLMQNGKYMGVIARNLDVGLHSWKWLVGKLNNGALVDPGTGYRVRIVREYKGPVVPIMQLWDEAGDFNIARH